MENEFVPYQQSLELKELGFDEPCFGYYHICNTDELKEIYECDYFFHEKSGNFNSNCLLLKAPLYQQAFRWFREKYKLRFIIQSSMSDLGEYFKLIFPDGECRCMSYPTYEEAELACLKKLIEIVKQK
jgi:hypothetical protein